GKKMRKRVDFINFLMQEHYEIISKIGSYNIFWNLFYFLFLLFNVPTALLCAHQAFFAEKASFVWKIVSFQYGINLTALILLISFPAGSIVSSLQKSYRL